MESGLFEAVLVAAESHSVYAEDFADRLASKYTSVGLLALAAVCTMRQYVIKPIQCWVPAEWTRAWEEYAETYCWTQGTYRVSLTEVEHPAAQKRGELAINYYQWVPILLLAQAALVMLPHQLWCLASRFASGRDPHTVVRFARDVERAVEPTARKRLQVYAAWQLTTGIRLSDAKAVLEEAGRIRGCSESVRQSGCALFGIYMVSKAAHLLSSIGQLFLLQSYLGSSSPLFGWHLARELLLTGGEQWRQTGVFPRLTFCDLPLRHVSQWNVRSIQCVLAANMVYEKIFVFLWFWFAFCCLATGVYTICWMLELLPASGRHRAIRSLVRLLGAEVGRRNPEPLARDVGGRLRLDGVFLLRMIEENADSLCAAQVLEKLLPPADEHPRQVGAAAAEPRQHKKFGPVSRV